MTTITIDKELLEQVVNKLLTCWPKSDPLVNELRAALAAPATAPEPVAWLAHYVGRSGMEQEYVSTDKNLADENDRRVRRLVTTEKSMSAVEIVEWKPTPETRWYSPDRRYVPERLERRFECKASDGTSGHLWAEVYPESPFVRVTKTPNVEFSGVPAGHSSNHPAGGTSDGTQG